MLNRIFRRAGKLNVTLTKLQDVKIIEPAVFGDQRGFFSETYSDRDFKEIGIDFDFIVKDEGDNLCNVVRENTL